MDIHSDLPGNKYGFTLIELMVTLAVLGILAMIAIPSLTSMIRDNRQTSQINTFLSNIHLARSEAIKRNTPVTLCKSSDQSSCDTTSGNYWEQGWIVFVDSNGDGQKAAAAEPILKISTGLNHQTLRATTSYTNSLTFNHRGLNKAYTSGLFSLCDERGASNARAIRISAIGQASATKVKLDGTSLECP